MDELSLISSAREVSRSSRYRSPGNAASSAKTAEGDPKLPIREAVECPMWGRRMDAYRAAPAPRRSCVRTYQDPAAMVRTLQARHPT